MLHQPTVEKMLAMRLLVGRSNAMDQPVSESPGSGPSPPLHGSRRLYASVTGKAPRLLSSAVLLRPPAAASPGYPYPQSLRVRDEGSGRRTPGHQR